jgi:hypothetical protein
MGTSNGARPFLGGVMRVAALNRWHWVVIALAVGLTCGGVWQSARNDLDDGLDRYGALLTSQRRFETALVSRAEGLPMFKDIRVYPYRTRAAGGRREVVYVVAGQYWDGRPVAHDGKYIARYVPTCYLAATPYTPVGEPPAPDASGANAPATPGRQFATVLDYLADLRTTRGVAYRYAWWWWAAEPLFLWTVGSLVLIGGLWPTLVNLLAYGSFLRPADAETFSLRNIRLRRKPLAIPTFASGPMPDSAHAPTQPAAPPQQEPAFAFTPAAAPLDAPAEAATLPPKHFDAGDDDFYPTELTDHHGHPSGRA